MWSCERAKSPSLEQIISLTPASEDRTGWSMPHLKLTELDCARPSNHCKKLETEVRNGDCLPACFCAMLEYLNQGRVSSTSLVQPAARLRADLIEWIKDNWKSHPVYNPYMTVHEIVHMQHAVGIPPSEATEAPNWGSTPEEHLAAYEAQCERIYFSDAEMMLFSSWLWEKRGIACLFRVYRGDTPVHVVDIPAPTLLVEMGCTRAVVVELDHTGAVDSRSAHYRLIAGASLSGIACGFAPRAPPKPTSKKRKRPALLIYHAPSSSNRRCW